MWIIGLSVVVGIILVSFIATPMWRREDEDSPSDILKRRYARGEIDRPTYEQMLRDVADRPEPLAGTAAAPRA